MVTWIVENIVLTAMVVASEHNNITPGVASLVDMVVCFGLPLDKLVVWWVRMQDVAVHRWTHYLWAVMDVHYLRRSNELFRWCSRDHFVYNTMWGLQIVFFTWEGYVCHDILQSCRVSVVEVQSEHEAKGYHARLYAMKIEGTLYSTLSGLAVHVSLSDLSAVLTFLQYTTSLCEPIRFLYGVSQQQTCQGSQFRNITSAELAEMWYCRCCIVDRYGGLLVRVAFSRLSQTL